MLDSRRYIVTSAPGLQELLAAELNALDIESSIEPSGAVTFEGGWDKAARVLIESRIAGHVQVSIRRFAASSRAMLYDQVRRVDWPDIFVSERSFSVKAAG